MRDGRSADGWTAKTKAPGLFEAQGKLKPDQQRVKGNSDKGKGDRLRRRPLQGGGNGRSLRAVQYVRGILCG